MENETKKYKGPIAWMAGHSVTANLLMMVLLIGGFIVGSQIKKEVFPDFELDRITVTVPYPGASPEEVERGIILSIEEAVQGLEGVKEITVLKVQLEDVPDLLKKENPVKRKNWS